MNDDVTLAVLRLQGSLLSGRLPHWRAEQTEAALNGLLRHPDRTGEPFHLQRNAMSDARKKLQRRAALLAERLAETGVPGSGHLRGRVGAEPYAIILADVVDTVVKTVSEADRAILAIALQGGGAGDVAEAMGLPYDVAKVRLSRARQRARLAWAQA